MPRPLPPHRDPALVERVWRTPDEERVAGAETFTVRLAEDQKDSSDITITIGFVSSGVTYHYRK